MSTINALEALANAQPGPGGKRRVIVQLGGDPNEELLKRQRANKPPSLLKQSANFVKASAQHLAAGAPLASDKDVAERFAICQLCELFKPLSDGQGQCTHPSCGCSLKRVGLTGKNKLRWAEQKCPIDKWGPVEPVEKKDSAVEGKKK